MSEAALEKARPAGTRFLDEWRAGARAGRRAQAVADPADEGRDGGDRAVLRTEAPAADAAGQRVVPGHQHPRRAGRGAAERRGDRARPVGPHPARGGAALSRSRRCTCPAAPTSSCRSRSSKRTTASSCPAASRRGRRGGRQPTRRGDAAAGDPDLGRLPWQGYVQRPHTGEQGITVSYSGQGELQLTSPTTSDGGGSDVSG